MTPFRATVVVLLALSSWSVVSLAQSGPPAAALVKTEGVVYLNGKPVVGTAMPITLGEAAQLRSDAGRAIVFLKRGGLLALADRSAVTVLANGVYNFNRIELLAGSAVIVSGEGSPLIACGTDVRVSTAGVYRFDVQTPEPQDGSTRCLFRVYEGAGTTQGPSVTYILRAGERMGLNRRAGDMIPVQPFPQLDLDEFDRWTRHQAVVVR